MIYLCDEAAEPESGAEGIVSRRMLLWSPAAGSTPSTAPERHVAEKFATAHARMSGYGSTHLHDLVARIATGDHSAFRSLYAVLAMRVWRDASRRMPHPVDSQAVMRSTFVEVWHRAKHHLDDGGPDTADWIAEITAQHVEERLRSIDTPLRGDYDRYTYRKFAAMIGAGGTRPEPEPIELPLVHKAGHDEPATVWEEAES